MMDYYITEICDQSTIPIDVLKCRKILKKMLITYYGVHTCQCVINVQATMNLMNDEV